MGSVAKFADAMKARSVMARTTPIASIMGEFQGSFWPPVSRMKQPEKTKVHRKKAPERAGQQAPGTRHRPMAFLPRKSTRLSFSQLVWFLLCFTGTTRRHWTRAIVKTVGGSWIRNALGDISACSGPDRPQQTLTNATQEPVSMPLQ